MKIGGINAGAMVHDPSVYVENNKFYVFGTHMTLAESDDLRYWHLIFGNEDKDNGLFDNLFSDDMEPFSYCGSFNDSGEWAVWAPDVVYLERLKKYVMYFCISGSYVKSNICMATADKLKGPYHFEKRLLYSGFTEETMAQTNVEEVIGSLDVSKYVKKNGHYNNINWPNCIDPNVFYDKDGKLWMVYGSWSGGIFLLEIDQSTGLPIHPESDERNKVDAYFGKKLLGGGHKSIEGPCVMYDEKLGYYYLFVSYGRLQKNGGYNIRVFRSKKPDGPYLDMNGKTFTRVSDHSPFGLKLIGNYMLPSLDCAYKSPGHNSIFRDEYDNIYIVYHQRFDRETEGDYFEPRVHQLFRTNGNWLTASPFATSGEMIVNKAYHENEISGTYYAINHGIGISNKVHQPVKLELKNGGIYRYEDQIDGSENKLLDPDAYGTYELSNNSAIVLKIKDRVYNGVIVHQVDEAGNPTMCISAVGENYSYWAVRYL